MYKKLSSDEKERIIKRIINGEKLAHVSRTEGVCRTILYTWLKNYKASGKKQESLKSKRPCGQKHWRHKPGLDVILLPIIKLHPDFTLAQLVQAIKKHSSDIVLGTHGIYNFLKRFQLNTYEQRLAYGHSSVASASFVGLPRIELPSLPEYSFLSFLSPPGDEALSALKYYAAFFLGFLVVIIAVLFIGRTIAAASSITVKTGMFFCFVSLFFGVIFLLYSLKSYFTIAIILSHSRKDGYDEPKEKGGLFKKIFGISVTRENGDEETERHAALLSAPNTQNLSLNADVTQVKLERSPFVSIHVSTYNEKRVIQRLLTAVTNIEYSDYEVIIADDSTDETIDMIRKWEIHPKVKISHRTTRDGFKGGALAEALRKTDPRAEFVLVFDADFIPYPDTIVQFLKYFQLKTGSLSPDALQKSSTAAVQGYQWHILNKSENWITRGVRSEYAGSYVIERSGSEVYGGFKQIAGSVYMIRRDILEAVGWGTSITEDFQLTLKLYAYGFKVLYVPYIQVPAEAVSTIKRMIRQRMRWAEGHSYNVKKMFCGLLRSEKLSFPEKLDFLFLSPYYLQAGFFCAGTISWFLAEVIFQTRLPFWTSVWGWSLVFTNMLALPLMNMVGLFMEDSEKKDYTGLFSFVALSYILAPFQAYAAAKGFIEKQEGPWVRTPKTGHITDTFMPGRIYKYITRMLG